MKNLDSLLFQVKLGFIIETPNEKKHVIVGGIDTSKHNAIIKARSEFWERYVATYVKQNLINNSIEQVKKYDLNFIHPKKIVQNTKDKIPKKNQKMSWVCGKTLYSGNNVLIPAASVFINYYNSLDHFRIHKDATGLACSNTISMSIYNGIFEVLERDQISIFWDFKNSFGRELVNWRPCVSTKLKKYLDSKKFEVFLIYLDEFIKFKIHTIIALITYNGKLTVGSATHSNIKFAVKKSILEGVMLQQTMNITNVVKYDPYESSISHVKFAYDNSTLIEHYIKKKINNEIDIEELFDKSPRPSFHKLIKYLHGDICYYNFLNPDKTNNVVRVIIPSCYNKHNSNLKYHIICNEILKNRLKKFGSILNEMPHPFG